MNKKGFTLIELIIVIAILTILFAIASRGCSRGTGDNIGRITGFDENTFVFNTTEAQMILGGHGTVTSNIWEFSVLDKGILNQLTSAKKTQNLVQVHYKKVLFPQPWLGYRTLYIAIGVVFLKDQYPKEDSVE
jgi:prepilin-type N-terminal cleavage/methylation domain-containing protein